MKKIALIIASENFKDEEYFVAKEEFEGAGVGVETVSNKTGIAQGSDGGEAQVDKLLCDINIDGYDAVVFIGGSGCLENLDNQTSYNIAKSVIDKNKVLAAICISPVILANAGILEGKKTTVWTSDMDKNAAKILKEKGADYQKQNLVVDGDIITACGPQATKEFAREIIDKLL
ncbi:MAG: DJ-1/PfpI family protein [bacterium]